MFIFSFFTPYLCTIFAYKAGIFIWDNLCCIFLLILHLICILVYFALFYLFLYVRGVDTIRPYGSILKTVYYAYILQFMLIFGFVLQMFAQLLFTKMKMFSEIISMKLVYSFFPVRDLGSIRLGGSNQCGPSLKAPWVGFQKKNQN